MSVRSEYSKKELRKQIDAKRDERVRQAQETFAYDGDIAARRDEWREEAEKSIRALYRKLKTITDAELSGFRVKSTPSRNSYSSPESVRDREIKYANSEQAQAIRRLESIRADDDILRLTPSMVRDLFGL